jgi:hypothetical protein
VPLLTGLVPVRNAPDGCGLSRLPAASGAEAADAEGQAESWQRCPIPKEQIEGKYRHSRTFEIKTSNSNKERTTPLHKKKHTTPEEPDHRSQESSVPSLPAPEGFHHYLRAQIREATRVVMEEIMREELTQFLGAEWGESTPSRKGYRNGSYVRDLATSSGKVEELRVPRDRAGQFQTQIFDHYSRYESKLPERRLFSRIPYEMALAFLLHAFPCLIIPVKPVYHLVQRCVSQFGDENATLERFPISGGVKEGRS